MNKQLNDERKMIATLKAQLQNCLTEQERVQTIAIKKHETVILNSKNFKLKMN
jgi:hypothetical protein